MQVDACDEAAIQGVCETAIRQEGKLDIFFANVRLLYMKPLNLTSIYARRLVSWEAAMTLHAKKRLTTTL